MGISLWIYYFISLCEPASIGVRRDIEVSLKSGQTKKARSAPSRAYSRKNILDSSSNIVGISPLGIMRRLVVVATTRAASVNRFPQSSLTEARNMKDFLEQTGDYSTVKIYELEKTLGPLQQWAELEESTR